MANGEKIITTVYTYDPLPQGDPPSTNGVPKHILHGNLLKADVVNKNGTIYSEEALRKLERSPFLTLERSPFLTFDGLSFVPGENA